jgi:threonine synthase
VKEQAETTAAAADNQDVAGDVIPDDYKAFVEHEYVQQQIQAAKNTDNVTPRYVEGVVKLILQRGGEVTRQSVADDMGISTPGNIGKAMRALADHSVITLSGTGKKQTADFDFEKAQRQHGAEQIIEGTTIRS